MTASVLVWLLLLAALVALPSLFARDAARARIQRAGFFSDCLSLFSTYRVTMTGQAFPVLEGRYRGHDARLELVLDDMAWRKLPSLWLKATIFKPHPLRSVLDFLMRPQGGEFYSPSGEMVYRLPVPAAWPQNAILCADKKDASAESLSSHMVLFEDPRAKELVTTPRGVRLVYQAAQAERSHYLVLRQARFENSSVPTDLVRSLLDRAIAIAAAMDSADIETERKTEAA